MKKNLKRIVAVMLSLCMLFALCACGGGNNDTPSSSGASSAGANSADSSAAGSQDNQGGSDAQAVTEITMAMDGEPSSLNPYTMGGTKASNFMLHTAYAVLWRVEADDSLTCDLAESYTVDYDNLIMTVKLREGLKFSDGSALTAEDVVCSLKTSAADSGSNTGSLDLDNTKVIDETTVQIGLKSTSYATMVDISCIGIISAAWTEDGSNAEKKAATPVCSGAYYIESWTTGEDMVYLKNPNYWNAENVKYDKITVKCIADETTRFLEYQSGGADLCYLTNTDNVAQIDNGLVESELYLAPMQSVQGIAFDTESVDDYKNENLRLAVAHAIDMEALVNAYCGQYYSVAKSIYPSTSAYFVDCALEYDPDLAKEYLNKYYEETGATTATVHFTAMNGNLAATLSEALQYQLGEVLGITVEVEVIDSATYFDKQIKGEQYASIVPISRGYYDPSKYMNAWMSYSSNVIMHMPSEELDALLNQTVTDMTVSADERAQLLADLQESLVGTGKFIPMFEEFISYAYGDTIPTLDGCISGDGRMLQGLFLNELPEPLVQG